MDAVIAGASLEVFLFKFQAKTFKKSQNDLVLEAMSIDTNR